MKKVIFSLLATISLFAFTPEQLVDKSFELSGKFYYYPFYPKSDPKSAFNWIYEDKSYTCLPGFDCNEKFYQLMGTEHRANERQCFWLEAYRKCRSG